MKSLLSVIVFLCFISMPAMAADIGFAWDYGVPMPSGFEMTLTPTTGTSIMFDCGAAASKTCTVTALPAGSFSAYVRAYNIGVPATLKVYSDPSNTVPLTIPGKPTAPSNNRIIAAIMAGVGFVAVLMWALIRKLK
jgi:hypothetical protein